MLIRRNIVADIVQALRTRAIVAVEALPGTGRRVLAGQLAAAFPGGAVVLDSRGAEARRIARDPDSVPSAKPCVFLHADAARAAALEAKRAAGALSPRQRFALIGGPFPADDPRLRLEPFSLAEVGRSNLKRHWLRGGLPEAYLAANDGEALETCARFAADLAYGALAGYGLSLEPDAAFMLLEALAQGSGKPFNANAAARRLGTSRPTIERAVAAFERAGIARSLPSFDSGLPGRTVRAPALFLRDTGLLHALVGLRSAAELAVRGTVAAAGWRAYCLERTAEILPAGLAASRFLSANGASLDLVLSREGRNGKRAACGAVFHHAPDRPPSRGAAAAADRLGIPDGGRFIVSPGTPPREFGNGFRGLDLCAFLDMIRIMDPDTA